MDSGRMFHLVNEHAADFADRLFDVSMRAFSVGADDCRMINILLTEIAMRITDNRNRQIRTGDLSDCS